MVQIGDPGAMSGPGSGFSALHLRSLGDPWDFYLKLCARFLLFLLEIINSAYFLW